MNSVKKAVIKDPVELEKIIDYYLSNDLPLSSLEDNYFLSYPQREFLLKKSMGYSRQREKLEEEYKIFDVSSEYLEMSHFIEEEKALKPEEQIKLFKRLHEIDKDRVIKRMVATSDELSRHRTVMKRILNKYQKEMKLCDTYVLQYGKESLSEFMGSKGYKCEKINEILEMYDYYLSVKKKISELTKKRNNILAERRKLLDENQEYANITQKLVTTNVKLANWIVRDGFKNIPLPKEEAQALALEGLGIAINRFDYTMGYNFSTYAFKIINSIIKRRFKSMMGVTWITYCMKQNIAYWREELLKMDSDRVKPYSADELVNSGLVRFSARQIRNLDEGVDVIYNFSDYYDIPDDSEIRTKGDMPMDQYDYDYLDAIDDNEGIFFEDETMGDDVYQESLSKAIKEVLGTLTEREQAILELRFGINDGQSRSLEAVAKEFFVTAERIRQQEAKALRKCRHANRREKLISYAEDYDIVAKSTSVEKASNEEIINAFMRLYDLRKSGFSNSAKAFFISTRRLQWDEKEVHDLDLLLEAFILNMQLGEKHVYPFSGIVDAFCDTFSHSYEYKYPYRLIYEELKKRIAPSEECCFSSEVQDYLHEGPENVINLSLKFRC